MLPAARILLLLPVVAWSFGCDSKPLKRHRDKQNNRSGDQKIDTPAAPDQAKGTGDFARIERKKAYLKAATGHAAECGAVLQSRPADCLAGMEKLTALVGEPVMRGKNFEIFEIGTELEDTDDAGHVKIDFAATSEKILAHLQSQSPLFSELAKTKKAILEATGKHAICGSALDERIADCITGLEKLVALKDDDAMKSENFSTIAIKTEFADVDDVGYVDVKFDATLDQIREHLSQQSAEFADLKARKRDFEIRSKGMKASCGSALDERLGDCIKGIDKLLELVDSDVIPSTSYSSFVVATAFKDVDEAGAVGIDFNAKTDAIAEHLRKQSPDFAELARKKQEFTARAGHQVTCGSGLRGDLRKCITGIDKLFDAIAPVGMPNASFGTINIDTEMTAVDTAGKVTIAYDAEATAIVEHLKDQ